MNAATSPDASLFDALLADRSLLLFGGKGGVGKTTMASATALHLADQGARVLLLSTDPAHSLRDSLGAAIPETLDVEEFDADAALDAFRAEHGDTLREIVSRGTLFDDADTEALVRRALPGLDEVMAMLRLADCVKAPAGSGASADASSYARVIVDTAPTGHTLRLLGMPDQFASWTGFLDVLLEKHRYMRARFTGRTEPDALDRFVDDLHAQAERVRDALQDARRTGFVVVTQAEPAVLEETRRFVAHLRAQGVSPAALVLNRWRPEQADALAAHRKWLADAPCWAVPELEREAQGADPLRQIGRRAQPLRPDADLDARGEENPPDPSGDASAGQAFTDRVVRPLPEPDRRLLLFAGKGGVGKTTMASATALHLADQGARVLLLSTDPAHSLGDVLGTAVDTTPTAVTERLDALHVDAEARFEELRTAYIDEVRGFVEQAGPSGVDLPYERRVAERLMDLAPPGLDEIAGLVVVMEQAEASRYNRLVLDAAPTGHFLRFVETPATMNEWIQTLYRLLRKYRRVVQAPRLADRLVRLSKQLRRFQRVVRNEPAPDRSQAADTGERAGSDGRVGRGKREAAPSASPPRSGVCAVTIPTAVARAETKRLVARCQGAGLDVPALIINRMPAGDEDAQRVVDALRADLDGPALGLVRDGTPPQGLRALTALGHALYDRR